MGMGSWFPYENPSYPMGIIFFPFMYTWIQNVTKIQLLIGFLLVVFWAPIAILTRAGPVGTIGTKPNYHPKPVHGRALGLVRPPCPD
jgi:hypothetical protein